MNDILKHLIQSLRCSNCHYWDPKKIEMKNKSFNVLYCWCYRNEKYMDATDLCDAYLSVHAEGGYVGGRW